MAAAPALVEFFATAPAGTEPVLGDELREIGIAAVRPTRGGVACSGPLEQAYRACLWSRVASRILLPLATFEARSGEELYEHVFAVDWPEQIRPGRTLAVHVAGRERGPAGSPRFVALKTKDAIVDRLRKARGERPDVDRRRPDLRVHVHLDGERLTVSIDLAGRGMHRRGIERAASAAPLKENLAAAILRLAGWPERMGEQPLLDPFCGSGTLLIEAAWMALDVAPGLARETLGARGWAGHDAAAWDALAGEALARRESARAREPRLAGFDASAAAIRAARGNLERAGVAGTIRLERRELRDARPPWADPGLLVANPPYGERLGEPGELGPLYESLGDTLRRRFPGWSCWILTGNPALAKRIGLRASSRKPLFNGPIECRLLHYPIAAGKPGSDHGPGWRKPSVEAGPFAKKLKKNARARARHAKRGKFESYRIYDSDLPEYNVAIDRYGGAIRVEEYPRPAKVRDEIAERRLQDVLRTLPEALDVDPAQIVLRVRSDEREPSLPEPRPGLPGFREVLERGMRFLVNLTDYPDSGLPLDERRLRGTIRDEARGVRFLNLFCHTGTASVAAALGGARTTNIDPSAARIAWARLNFERNGLDVRRHRFHHRRLREAIAAARDGSGYDLIYVAPGHGFDAARHHARLLREALDLVNPGGRLLFATRQRGFRLDPGLARRGARELDDVVPPDFASRPRLRAWELSGRGAAGG